MTFEIIQFLEKCLKQSHTYESVLSLKNDISKLIVAFNKLDKKEISNLSLKIMKTEIQNIREQYIIKIQALKNPGPYPVVLHPDVAAEMDFDLRNSLCLGLPHYFLDSHCFGFARARSEDEQSSRNSFGGIQIREEHVELPPIPRGSKVLDVGAYSGILSQKIQDSLGCDVYALEPNFECSADYESCVQRLGQNKVERLTLQEALASNPEKYSQAFDVVTVFKYNVSCNEKEEFIQSLAKVVKPGGTIFITSVESERFFLQPDAEEPYLIDAIQQCFGKVNI